MANDPSGQHIPLLLEIGTEEIPARFIPIALDELSKAVSEVFKENQIIYSSSGVKTFATPRRLALSIEWINDTQMKQTSKTLGPPKNIAYDANGKPTKAALGFAKKLGVETDALSIVKTEKGEYLQAEKQEGGGKTVDFLPEMLKKVVLSLHFPKSMRWGDGELKFARPIHWIVAVYGSDVINFEIDGIKSGNRTRGHRFLSPGDIEIPSADHYADILKNNSVIVEQSERVALIDAQSRKLARSVSGVPFYMQEDHKGYVANLVEYPQAVMGSFDEKYLELPNELLNSVMWGHQKYFPVVKDYRDKDYEGKGLKNNFIIVSNTKAENADTVRRGAERVIRARFDDARFYYKEDTQKPLAERVEALKKVTFHEKLGSLHDKTMRIQSLASRIADVVNPSLKGDVERAALLCKTDLITGVVYEFPELQGIMGRYYAINDGERKEVAEALKEHYFPAFAGDAVPEGDVGAIVGLADRMDNIAAFFSIGLKPTGSEDPFALRRQALAAIAILASKGYSISIGSIIDAALEGLGGLRGAAGIESEMLEFIALRFEGVLTAEGHPADAVQSVMEFAMDYPLGELKGRLDAVEAFKSNPGYNDFLAAIKRVRNITPKEEFPAPDAKLMQVDEEKALLQALGAAKAIEALVKGGDYSGALGKLLELTAPINNFFDKVLVMDKDEGVKKNRLALLKAVWATAARVADFSKLAERA